jgi:hypothetical protein
LQILKSDATKKAKPETQQKITEFLEGSFDKFIYLGKTIKEFNVSNPTLIFSKKNIESRSLNPTDQAIEILYEVIKETGKTITPEKAQKLAKVLKAAIEEDEQPEENNITDITHEHQKLVKKFIDKEAAKEFDSLLIKLEKLSVKDYYKYMGEIKGLVKHLENKGKPQEDSKKASGEK